MFFLVILTNDVLNYNEHNSYAKRNIPTVCLKKRLYIKQDNAVHKNVTQDMKKNHTTSP